MADFLDNYVRAREIQADSLIDDILEIADNSMNDWIERESERTGKSYIALNDEAIARAKLRVEARFRLAERLHPKRWGAKTVIAGDQENPLVLKSLSGLTVEELKNLAKLGTDE